MAGPRPSTALVSVEDAQSRIQGLAGLLPVVSCPLGDALGRVLAEPLTARRSQPPLDVSAMDGYAVRAGDLDVLPCRLHIAGEAAAGDLPGAPLAPGSALRIFTGAAIPPEADMVVIQENASVKGGLLTIHETKIETGLNIRKAGGDFSSGAILLEPPRRLTARDIALAAAMDYREVPVLRKPRVAILATGDELTHPGEPRSPSQVVASSLYGLEAQVQQWNASAYPLPIVSDDPVAIQRAISFAIGELQTDIVVTLGGASVGDRDHIQAIFKSMGAEFSVLKVAMRPGKPLMAASLGRTVLLALPGNPVSAMVCAMLFLRTAISAMEGVCAPDLPTEKAVAGAALGANDNRQDFIRARLADGCAVPFPVQDSGQLFPLAQADCLIVRAPFAPACAQGETVDIWRL